jgi:hypothetical protein
MCLRANNKQGFPNPVLPSAPVSVALDVLFSTSSTPSGSLDAFLCSFFIDVLFIVNGFSTYLRVVHLSEIQASKQGNEIRS